MTQFFRTSRASQKHRRWLLASLLALTSHSAVQSADIIVTSTNDSGAGTLREALTTAVSGDRIVFNIPGGGTQTITLASPLPNVTRNVTFSNPGSLVSINRGVNAGLNIVGSVVNPTGLSFTPAGVTNDISATPTSRIFGSGEVIGNVQSNGTIAPGTTAAAGSIGTLTVTGNLDASNSTIELDVTGDTTLLNDQIIVTGTTDISGATLNPIFRGSNYEIGDTITVLESDGALTGDFVDTGEFQLQNNPFLEAEDAKVGNEIRLTIQDNELNFAQVVQGCNNIAAAAAFDEIRSLPGLDVLRNGSTQQVATVVNQLSGSIYANLLDAEIQHMQMNLNSIRDRVVMELDHPRDLDITKAWARGYGMDGQVGVDDCLTEGYHQQTGGLELGAARFNTNGLAIHGFAHLANSDLNNGDAGQNADIGSYRGGGAIQYVGARAYAVGMAGGGGQTYDVQRSLAAVPGASSVESSFGGLSRYGYVELGTMLGGGPTLWLPHIGLQSLYTDIDSAREDGDANFGLNVNGNDFNSLRSLVGIDLQQSAPTELGPATTRIRVGWFHEYLDDNITLANQFQSADATTPFTSDSVDAGRDWASIGVQLDWMTIFGGRLSGGYQGFYNSDTTFHLGTIGSTWMY